MSILTVVPFRRQSTRIPEKIYYPVTGSDPLCVHVMKKTMRAVANQKDTQVLAAVDDVKTAELLKNVLAEENIILTDPALPSGTDRVYAASKIYCSQKNINFYDLNAIVNIQGDMPFMSESALKSLWPRFADWKKSDKLMLTPYESWPQDSDPNDLGNVKIATNKKNEALYFSRHPIPCSREFNSQALKMHVGVYAYTANALEHFCKSKPTDLEKLEGLEQLRALYEGIPIECIHVTCLSNESFRGIDTPSDLVWAKEWEKLSC